MTKQILLTFLAAALSACGGGSDTSTTPLSKYLGNWKTACKDYAVQSVSISEANSTYTLTPKTEHFERADCTGAVVATETFTDFTVIYQKPQDVSFYLTPTTPLSTYTVDWVSFSAPQFSRVIDGSAVTRSVRDGVPEWCITITSTGGSYMVCSLDTGPIPAKTFLGGLYLQDNQIAIFLGGTGGSTYTSERLYTRR